MENGNNPQEPEDADRQDDDVKQRSRQPYIPEYPGFHKACALSVSSLGQRNLAWLLSPALGVLDTLVFFDAGLYPGVRGKVALTIDDAPCRQDADHCLSKEVCDVLRKYDAQATFFIASGFVEGKEDHVLELLRNGHEIGNHAVWDCPYTQVDVNTFEKHLMEAEDCLDRLREQYRQDCLRNGHQDGQTDAGPPKCGQLRWFRAPGGRLSFAMHEVVVKNGFQHVLGDCYANDTWVSDPEFIARLMVKNATDGSILIIHMPEKGFREHCLQALESLLKGLSAAGLQAMSLSAVHEAAVKEASFQNDKSSMLSMALPDQTEFEHQPARHMYRSTNFFTGFANSSRALGESIYDGVSGVVLDPLNGWRESGITGLAQGTASGLTGLAMRPIGGIVRGQVQLLAGVAGSALHFAQWSTSSSNEEDASPPEPSGHRSEAKISEKTGATPEPHPQAGQALLEEMERGGMVSPP